VNVPPWLLEQHVPLAWFLLALLTNPSTWTDRARTIVEKRFLTERDDRKSGHNKED